MSTEDAEERIVQEGNGRDWTDSHSSVAGVAAGSAGRAWENERKLKRKECGIWKEEKSVPPAPCPSLCSVSRFVKHASRQTTCNSMDTRNYVCFFFFFW